MKKFNLTLVAVLAMSTFAVAGGDIAPVEPIVETPVIVEEDNSAFYLGLGYGYFAEKVELGAPFNEDETFDMNSVMFQAGYQFNKYVAAEGRYWLGVSDLKGDNETLTGDFSTWGIYVKPQYPVAEAFNIYALLGYASTELKFDAGQGTEYFDSDSFSWGLGAEYLFTENVSVFVDYTALAYTDEFKSNGVTLPKNTVDVTIDTVNVGVSYKF